MSYLRNCASLCMQRLLGWWKGWEYWKILLSTKRRRCLSLKKIKHCLAALLTIERVRSHLSDEICLDRFCLQASLSANCLKYSWCQNVLNYVCDNLIWISFGGSWKCFYSSSEYSFLSNQSKTQHEDIWKASKVSEVKALQEGECLWYS